MKIAMLVPSRERIVGKRALAGSIMKTANNLDNVRLYFGIDDNDPTKPEALKISQEFPFVKIIEIPSTEKFEGLGRLWNICARATNEEIMAMIGDDMVFVTKGWDDKILEEFDSAHCPSDNLKMVYCYDGRHGPKIAVNAFVHRKYMDITGYFMREEFKVDFIDLWLHQIFASLGRIKYRGDIHIEHNHWSFGKMAVDNTARNLRGNNYPEFSQRMWASTKNERVIEAQKIASVLGLSVDLTKIDDRIVG